MDFERRQYRTTNKRIIRNRTPELLLLKTRRIYRTIKGFNTVKGFSTIEEVLGELRQGKIVLVTDDESRENEGDLICAAQHTTTENANFMVVHGKDLVCMSISPELCTRLKLPRTVSRNSDNHETTFTVSIDHISTSTGISVTERGVTARQRVNARSWPEDFWRPSHMSPLAARKNGVLERTEYIETTVNLMCLAGLSEYELYYGIMKEDGTMMRTPQLLKLTGQWNMKITTIKALQSYRKQRDKPVECAVVTHTPTRHGTLKAYGYRNLLNGEHHVTLVKGEIEDGRDLLCQVHSECLTGNTFGSPRCDCGQQFAIAIVRIEQEERGVLLYMHQEGRDAGLLNKLRAYEFQDQGMDTLEANLALGLPGDLREYFIGAQILRDLGVRSLRLLTNNPDKIYQLSGFGLEVRERVPIRMAPVAHDLLYLKTRE